MMDLAAHYHQIFLQETSFYAPFLNTSSDCDSPSISSSFESAPVPTSSPWPAPSLSSSPEAAPGLSSPCWDLDSLEDSDLYQPDSSTSLYQTPEVIKQEDQEDCSKTTTPTLPSTQVRKKRRVAANARERKRMDRINSGFVRLRQVLPGPRRGRELSKMEALQVARSYILTLAEILQP